ncbi:histidine--tRNA ligase [Amnibacterium sp. CER49]|uniref:histidine--tRNA ligase n=1 Tax=Amnibacterium sp. CER49 TaxID=3039161 RepID=UPI00244C5EAC|nr:histidine--tRNA ligase [Amnibacterium sp. CER49]MDH2445433.1 histidine--tRNA ligase [Amnibacterium sp. CER49]
MASPVNPPRGMRDFLPAEKRRREHALAVIRRVYRGHGFDEIETPALEDVERLHAGIGGDNEKLAYSVLKRGLGGDDLRAAAESGDPLALADLGLRYDLTVPLARYYATNRAELPPVFRALQIGPVWRAERPQKGRYRQFVQCDIDVLGEAGPIAELELIAATTEALAELGLTGTSVRINDRRILNRLLETWGLAGENAARALITIDKLDKIGVPGVVDELGTQGVDTAGLHEAFATLAAAGWDLLVDPPAWLEQDAYRDLLALRDALPDVDLVFDPTLVRGMGYYTGTIFEIEHPGFGSSLGGGGRYDGMIGRFLGQAVPAVGFSIGFERILDLLPPSDDGSGALVLLHDDDVPAPVLLAAKAAARDEHGRVRLERTRRNRRAQLDALAAEGFTAVATVTAEGTGETRPLR